jgi:hypothetical protein
MAPGQASLLSWFVVFGLLAGGTAVAQFATFRMLPGIRSPSGRWAGRGLVAVSTLTALVLTLYLSLGRGNGALWDVRWLDGLRANGFAAITILSIAVWLWWWGLMAGRSPLHYRSYAGNFALGIAGLGMAALLSYATLKTPPGALLGAILAFFAVSLITLAAVSLRGAQRFERERSNSTPAIGRYWLVSIGGVVVVLLGIGLLLVQLFTPDTLRQVLATATPVVFRPMQGRHWFPSPGHVISDAATDYWSTAPGIRVNIPGMAPLTIGCRDTVSGLDFRFSWHEGVPVEAARSDYEVSGTDWLTLVEKFGLAPQIRQNT